MLCAVLHRTKNKERGLGTDGHLSQKTAYADHVSGGN